MHEVSNTLTISAQLVAEPNGVGLPKMWMDRHGTPQQLTNGEHLLGPERVMVGDHQTRSGLLRQLAMWCGDGGEAQAYWLEQFGANYRLVSSIRPVAMFSEQPKPAMGWFKVHMQSALPLNEAIRVILTAIGKGEVTR